MLDSPYETRARARTRRIPAGALEDSGEFVAASHTLSIPHPSGYPTYLLTAKLASLVPFLPTVVERVNFVSAIWTIAAAVLLYYALAGLFASRLIASSLALLFATSPMVWQQATYAEVYSLNTFFFVLLLWSGLCYVKRKTNKRLCLFFFVYGLSLTNHFLPLVLSPLIIIWLLKERPLTKSIVLYLKAFSAWLLGLVPYLYIPIRNQMDPAFSWFGGNAEKILTYNIAYGWRLNEHTLSYLADVAHQMNISFGMLGIAAFVAGIGVMVRYRHPARFWLLAVLALLSIGLVIVLTNGRPYAEFESQFYQTLYVPFLLMSLLPIGWLLQQLAQSTYRLIIFYTTLLAIMAWPAIDLGNRFLKNDRSDYVLMENYTRGLLESLPADGTLYSHHDHILNDTLVFGLAYQQYVAGVRDDVAIYSLTPVFPPPDDFPLGENRKQNYEPILKQYLDERYAPEDVSATFPQPRDGIPATAPENYAADNLYLPSVNDSLYHRSLVAKYYYDLAAYTYSRNNLPSGQRFLVQAIEYDPDQFSDYYYQTLAMRSYYFDN
ncbi:MAG: DUF2723 domain-containing protein [Parcubacteria group bacterium]|nr:DUF2723 domain-containing protein [Parcubacteria group bacterium]